MKVDNLDCICCCYFLGQPFPPQNLKFERIFEKSTGASSIRLYWEEPNDNGGTPIEVYVVQYKPEGIGWSQVEEEETEKLELLKLDMRVGKIYNVRVLAKNKVGRSKASNEVDIGLGECHLSSNRPLSWIGQLL